MKMIALVSCGKNKVNQRVKAKDLYTGDLFQKSRKYVENTYEDWMILSALHNLTDPEQEIDPYDYTLIGKSRSDILKWSEIVAKQIMNKYESKTHIHIFAGNDYRKFLVPILEEEGYRIFVPMGGLGIGQQKAWLKNRIGV